MDNYDFLLEDADLLEASEYFEILNEYKFTDSVLNKSKLKDEEYVERQIKNIKERKHPLTALETITYLAAITGAVLYFFNPIYVVLINVVLLNYFSGGFTIEKQDKKVKKRMLDSVDAAISKAEKSLAKAKDDKKDKLKNEIEKLKKNRELIETKLK